MNASLIIPSRGRPELLQATVDSILRGIDVPDELIVVDQSDVAHSGLKAMTTDRPCRLQYLWTPGVIGVSRARNTGIAASHHEILIFTDDDVDVSPEWCGTMVRSLRQAGPRAAVTGRVLPGPSLSPGGFAPSVKTDEEPATYSGRIGIGVLYSNNMALWRETFAEVGVFDERLGPGSPFRNAEDNDLCYRLLEAGYRILYEPRAVLHHLAWRGQSDYLPLRWDYGYGAGRVFRQAHAAERPLPLRQFARHLGRHLRQLGSEALHQRHFASDHAVYALGMVSRGGDVAADAAALEVSR